MKLERIRIEATGSMLAGLAYSPEVDESECCIVLSHGFTASKSTLDLLSSYLANRGFCCVTWDYRGHKLGASTGPMLSAFQAVDDLQLVLDFALRRFGKPRAVLIGHSMGALVSLNVGAVRDEVVAVACITVGQKPSASFQSNVGAQMLAQRTTYVEGETAPTLVAQLDELVTAVDRIAPKPTLFCAAKQDVLIRVSRMEELARRAGENHTFVEIEGGHQEGPDRARASVGKWLDSIT